MRGSTFRVAASPQRQPRVALRVPRRPEQLLGAAAGVVEGGADCCGGQVGAGLAQQGPGHRRQGVVDLSDQLPGREVGVAEEPSGQGRDQLRRGAAASGAAVAGSFPEEALGGLVRRSLPSRDHCGTPSCSDRCSSSSRSKAAALWPKRTSASRARSLASAAESRAFSVGKAESAGPSSSPSVPKAAPPLFLRCCAAALAAEALARATAASNPGGKGFPGSTLLRIVNDFRVEEGLLLEGGDHAFLVKGRSIGTESRRWTTDKRGSRWRRQRSFLRPEQPPQSP